jgi:hypothetical protein
MASFMDNGKPSPENFPGYGKEVKKRKSFRANCQNHHNNNNYSIVSYPLTSFLFIGMPITKETE